MYQESVRPLSEAEQNQLRAALAGTVTTSPAKLIGGVLIQGCAVAVCVFGIALTFYFLRSSLLGGIVILGLAIVAIVCLAAVIKSLGKLVDLQDLQQQFNRREAPEVEAALRDGRAKVQHVEASAVVEITVEEDNEGSIYAFDIGDARTLVVDSADWPAPDGPWPNSRFELVRTFHGDRVVAICCQGQRLRPLRVIKFEDCDEEFDWPDELAPVLHQSLDAFVRSTKA